MKISTDLWERINPICEQFEDAWCAGKPPVIEEYLPSGWPLEERFALFQQLLELDQDYRENRGEECHLDSYRSRFPEWISQLERESEASTQPPKPISPISGDMVREYCLLEKIGQGGMGGVYRAIHTKLDRVVALKLMSEDRLQDEESLSRFQREMKSVGRLHHPHIVSALDAGEYEDIPYLVMEYVDGVDLGTLVKQWGRFTIAESCELVRQAALGLQHAHDKGVVHRDLKPSNLMLTREGEVKLLDFGLAMASFASAERSLTKTGQVMGTIDYMAPEQAEANELVGPVSDIWSLGATLYRLLSGHPPFSYQPGASLMKRLRTILLEEITPITSYRSDLPEELVALVESTLQKDLSLRLAAPEDLIEALTPFCPGHHLPALFKTPSEPVAVPELPTNFQVGSDTRKNSTPQKTTPAPPPEEPKTKSAPAAPPTRRNWRLYAAAACVVLLIVCLMSVLFPR